MKCPSYDLFFNTVSNRLRLDIIGLLRRKSMSVTEICAALKEEQSKVSHNLKKMADCHIIEVLRKGKQRIYSLNKETMVPLMNLVQKHVESYCSKECKMR